MDSGKKVIIGMVAATVVLLIGGVFLISGRQPAPASLPDLVPEGAYKLGGEYPRVVLVEFGDFECPACAGYVPLVKQMLSEFDEDLAFVWRHFVLRGHKNSLAAATAAEAAGRQNKFWEMYEKLYSTQGQWTEADMAGEIFTGFAVEMGLDRDKFIADMADEKIAEKIQGDTAQAYELQLPGTPTFFLNGVQIRLPSSPENFSQTIREAIAGSPPVDRPEYNRVSRLKVILEGKELDLNEKKYMEGGSGTELITKSKTATLKDFFDSVKIVFTAECFELDSGEKYCNSGQKSLKMYVNGEVSGEYQNYVPLDGDRILLTYGDETVAEVQKQIESMDDGSVD